MMSSCILTIILVLPLILFSDCDENINNNSRIVFPFDFVKFTCRTSSHFQTYRNDGRDRCTWTFLLDTDSNSTHIKHETDCVQTRRGNATTKFQELFYEGYVQIPKKAAGIVCDVNETSSNIQTLSVQNVELADPLYRYFKSSKPTIVLQRFSSDYAVRLGVHDVTDHKVAIDGDEVESIKLLCISRNNVEWTNYTMAKQKVIKQLNSRDKEWLTSKTSDEAKIWKHYIALSQREDMLSATGLTYNYTIDEMIQIVPLTIRTLTKSSSRTYECREIKNDLKTTEESVSVMLHVQNPRLGPDEILLIQQIISLIDGLAQGERKEPWATLITLLTIVLLIFGYYCKKKLEQSSSQIAKPPEETEMNVTRRERRAQTMEQPVDSTVNEVQTQTN